MSANIFADFYLKVLGLIETIMGIFGADTSVISGLITDFEEALAKQDAAANN